MFLCSIVVTSEYIIETTQQLEGKLKEKVDPDFSGRISFGGEQNVYHGVITSCIQMLVQELETACEPPLSQVWPLTQLLPRFLQITDQLARGSEGNLLAQ